jgi:CelD/BcsL family acetyltransferase involved in cellulose biosynthesis
VPQITIARSAQEMAELRPLWQSLCRSETATLFQDFHWNLLALTMFAGREEPWVVCARSSYGVAIIPTVLRRSDDTLRLLGEELFDYRGFLHQGDEEILACALARLAPLGRRLEVVAMHEPLQSSIDLPLQAFSAAPAVLAADISADAFGAAHSRLARNLRRLERLGYNLKTHRGDNSRLVRDIYQRKAAQTPGNLFEDPLRIQFLVNAALFHPAMFEIFTLESGANLGAALVVLRDGPSRRFYTGWFDPKLDKHSPALALIYEVTRQSLAAGLDCDYMTGEQPYKLRLATRSVPLYRLSATPRQLAELPSLVSPLIHAAS